MQTLARRRALVLLLAAGLLTAFAVVPQRAEARATARPTVTIPSIQPNPGFAGLLVAFQANGQDADGDAITYAWTFGDGTPTSSTPSNYANHRYQKAGTYTVTVRASAAGEDSQPATATVKITALFSPDEPPTPPGNPRVTSASETSVSLAWDASKDDDGVAGYGILGGPGPQKTTATSYTFTDLACDEPYVFQLYAQDTLGAISELVSVTAHTSACTTQSETTSTAPPTATGSTSTGSGGTGTTPTTTTGGGSGGSGSSGGSQSSSLAVSGVKTVVVGRGAQRRVVLTLSVSQKARARVLLLKSARTVTSKLFRVKTGVNSLKLAVPRKTRAGAYTLEITVSNAKGDAKVVRRKVRIPR
jgi:PKD domain/Fibronectin type III domain